MRVIIVFITVSTSFSSSGSLFNSPLTGEALRHPQPGHRHITLLVFVVPLIATWHELLPCGVVCYWPSLSPPACKLHQHFPRAWHRARHRVGLNKSQMNKRDRRQFFTCEKPLFAWALFVPQIVILMPKFMASHPCTSNLNGRLR